MSQKLTPCARGGKTYDSGFNTDETSPIARIGPLVSAIRPMNSHVRRDLQSPTHANGEDVEKPGVMSCGVDFGVDRMPREDWPRRCVERVDVRSPAALLCDSRPPSTAAHV